MRTFFTVFLFLMIPLLSALSADNPNIVLLVADDMGFSDLGCYGGEIQTPNLDKLAANGLRFTQFYNTSRCWSTRCALATGYYPQQNGMDPARRDKKFDDWSPVLTKYLKPAGYRCYHSGKWHINGAPKAIADGNFDHSYILHDHNRNFNPQNHELDDQPLPPVQKDAGYYSTCAFTDYSLKFLDEHFCGHKSKPFFLFTAYTVPHFPLQALPEDIEKYRSTYTVGWDTIRKNRFEKSRSLGIVNCSLSLREEHIGPPYNNKHAHDELLAEVFFPFAWDSLTEVQKQWQTAKMAVHAAMVDRMDKEIGRIVRKLEENNVLDNTLIMFLTDNGASAEIMIRGDGHNPNAAAGSAESYLCLGPGWSTAANTPFRRHKVWNNEGGISTPFIVHYPKGIKKAETLRDDLAHVVDIVPTLIELTGGNPKEIKKDAEPPFPGVSLLPAILGSEKKVERDYIYFEHEGNAALRIGDWKILYEKTGEQPPKVPAAKSIDIMGWSLYNLSVDRAEQNDLSATEPYRIMSMVKRWRELNSQFHQQSSVSVGF
ncbi:MAG: arylsulfatase [Planctomycetaceae bacterium]|nr:arylsulfatase [Planctomycetaceae bacterium]